MQAREEEHWLTTPGGIRILTRHWRSMDPPKAALVICPGFNSHSGQYRRAASDLVRHDMAVTAVDLRGRGLSDGERFYVEAIEDYVADLSLAVDLAKSRDPDLPIFLLGHSAGGVTAVSYAIDHQGGVDGLICESFAYRVYAPNVVLTALKGLSYLAPHLRILKLKMADFSRDPERVALLESDPLTKSEVQPLRTVAALARASERLTREFEQITLPLLILHGTADKATRPEGSEIFFARAGSRDKKIILYDSYYHDPLNDLGRERIIVDIANWVEQRAAKHAASLRN
ncbi:alpha/beta hydrolase [Sphingopyxis sp.]|uniref:alpha/beta hydrolase n=1 Tax=Sphingopyxis sp. TaxID=1908224 RepID=UPI002637132F|nr:alpha/beta hydrolase [Sphingopyxis sp.]MCW0199854.1 lysophospholipase [Sphingopyxis sp.]